MTAMLRRGEPPRSSMQKIGSLLFSRRKIAKKRWYTLVAATRSPRQLDSKIANRYMRGRLRVRDSVLGDYDCWRSGSNSRKRRSRSQRPPHRRAPKNTGKVMLKRGPPTRTFVATAPPR
jgi:hypothetical protein